MNRFVSKPKDFKVLTAAEAEKKKAALRHKKVAKRVAGNRSR